MFKGGNTVSVNGFCESVSSSTHYKELALQAAINLLSNSLAKSEFKTYKEGKPRKGTDYYLFNVQANHNLSSKQFWEKVVRQLIYESECLVIMQDDKLYVADSFDRTTLVFKENIYKNIVIDDYKLDNVFRESQVLYFTWYNSKIKTVVDSINLDYSKLIESSKKGFKKSKANRGILEVGTSYPQTDQADEELRDLMDNKFKKYFDADGDALLVLANGLKYDEEGSKKGTTKSIENSNEVQALIHSIFDFVAMALRIPPSLLKGNVADTSNAVNEYLAFCLNPFSEFVVTEINRKLYTMKEYLEKTYMKCDTTDINVVDLNDIANSLEVLTRIGANNVDDSLEYLGKEPLNTPWSQAHWMTKNYERIESAYEAKGGD